MTEHSTQNPSDSVRFGILGTGSVAMLFARDLAHVDGARLAAVASRSADRASQFAAAVGAPAAFESYEKLIASDAVDVVYIATPHHRHADDALAVIGAGKAVLVEKPFTTDAQQARRVIDAARDAGVFCMEAMWTRFLPAVDRARKIIASGELGTLHTFHADFSLPTEYDPQSRFFNPELGGGALLDRAVYAVSMAVDFLDAPTSLAATATFARTGVDDHLAITLTHTDDRLSILSASLSAFGPCGMTLAGTTARITLGQPMCKPETLTFEQAPVVPARSAPLTAPGLKDKLKANPLLRGLKHLLAKPKITRLPVRGNGYGYEAAHVVHCMHNRLTESPRMPLDQTLTVMQLLDQARQQWGGKDPQGGKH